MKTKKQSTVGQGMRASRFSSAPAVSGLTEGYVDILQELKRRISGERIRAVLAANAGMVMLYWDIGKIILSRQLAQGWGAKVIDRLSNDLRAAFPDMRGLGSRNLKYMRAFAEAWPDRTIVQRVVAQLPWRHNIALLEQLPDAKSRLWYAREAVRQGWSHSILGLQIEGQAYTRQGKAVHNFPTTIPPSDSDMAAQVFKDPYLFDFLGTADHRRERDVESALVAHIQRFLLELGQGFSFVGQQVHLEVGDKDFYIDLLFYHLKLRCYVIVELKAVPFEPAFVGQLNMYLSAVDDLLRHSDDKPTIGLLLCRSKNKVVVEYALRDLNKPIGVASWQTRLVHALPKDLKGSLPTIQEIEAEMTLKKLKRKNVRP